MRPYRVHPNRLPTYFQHSVVAWPRAKDRSSFSGHAFAAPGTLTGGRQVCDPTEVLPVAGSFAVSVAGIFAWAIGDFMAVDRNQLVPIKMAVFMAAMLLAGCGDSTTTYRFEGAQGDFCVPGSVDVTLPGPGSGNVVQGGFALGGCWNRQGKACMGPQSLLSMAVGSRKDHHGWRFADFGPGAYIADFAIKEEASAMVLSADMMAILDAPNRDYRNWYVWRMDATPHTGMRADDQLMAVCSEARGYRGYFCHRIMPGPDYKVGYSYFAREKLPTSFDALDAEIISTAEALRCNQGRQ